MRKQRLAGRRRAAIEAAGVAACSRLTGADEAGAIARSRSLRRELIEFPGSALMESC